MISQIVTSKPIERRGGTQKLPYAFTENGVAMLSSVLRSPLAIQVNIGIMRAFTEFRKIAASLQIPDSQNDINEMTRVQLDAISTALAELQSKEPKPRKKIGFIQEEE